MPWRVAGFPIVGLVITVAIVAVLCGAGRDVLSRLMDNVDPALVTATEHGLTAGPRVREVRMVRMRWVGHELVAEAEHDVVLSLILAEAHEVAHGAERDLNRAVHKLTRATVHACPPHDGAEHHRASEHRSGYVHVH